VRGREVSTTSDSSSASANRGGRVHSYHGERDMADLLEVLEARQQALGLQREKRNVICRALQCQWLLIQEKLENAGSGGDSLYDNAYLMLEPEFQPISPATDIPESMRIFEEHKKLAKDYLQTRTEIECLLQAKKDLEKQLKEQERYGKYGGDPQQQPDSHRMLQEWRELKSENESLLQYHRNLKKQLEIIKTRRQHIPTSGTQDFEPEPGWVLVSRRDGADPNNPNMPSGRGAPPQQ